MSTTGNSKSRRYATVEVKTGATITLLRLYKGSEHDCYVYVVKKRRQRII